MTDPNTRNKVRRAHKRREQSGDTEGLHMDEESEQRCKYCGGAGRFQIVSSVADHAWANCFCTRQPGPDEQPWQCGCGETNTFNSTICGFCDCERVFGEAPEQPGPSDGLAGEFQLYRHNNESVVVPPELCDRILAALTTREAVVEECAKVAQGLHRPDNLGEYYRGRDIAAAIRALAPAKPNTWKGDPPAEIAALRADNEALRAGWMLALSSGC